MIIKSHPSKRAAVASVEMAFVLTFILFPVLIGVWEIGRLIHVQQVVSNSAREGARMAAQGRTINRVGAPTQILTSVAPAVPPATPSESPNVKAAVFQSLHGAGLTNLTWDDVIVTFQFLDQPTGAPSGPGTSNAQPVQGVKDQRFRVTVTIPYAKVRWINFGLASDHQVSENVEWRMLVDEAFTFNSTLPTW